MHNSAACGHGKFRLLLCAAYFGGFFMSGALMNKVWDLFGMDTAEAEEYDEEDVYEYEDEEEIEDRKIFGRNNWQKMEVEVGLELVRLEFNQVNLQSQD